MKVSHLEEVRSGKLDFEQFYRSQVAQKFVTRLVGYFWRRDQWSKPIGFDREDLEQLAWTELWLVVRSHRYRCSVCSRSFLSLQRLSSHSNRIHGSVDGSEVWDLLADVYRRVGRTLDHSLRRHVRRASKHGEVPEFWEPSQPADQEKSIDARSIASRIRDSFGDESEQLITELVDGSRVKKQSRERLRRVV